MNYNVLKKEFMKYVALNIIAMIGLSGYILADTYFVSAGVGMNGLTALNLAIPVYSFINGIGLMLGIGGATGYSISKAKQETGKASQIFTHAMVLAMILGLLFCLAGILFSESLCRLLGSDFATFAATNTYLKTLMCFAPAFIVNNVLVAFVRNDNAPNLSMIAMLTGSISNIFLDYIFIFPCGMGMFGAAFATGLAPVLSMVTLSLHLWKGKNQFHLVSTRIYLSFFKNICSLGIASMITEMASGIVMILFNCVILGLNGNPGVAAYGIIANLALVSTALFTGIAQGCQPLISTCYGLGKKENIQKISRWANMLSIIIAVSVCLVSFFQAESLAAIFNSEHNAVVADLAVQGLHIYFIGFLFAGYNIIRSSFFSSIEKPVFAFTTSILRGCVIMVPCLFLLSACFGMKGVWLSFPVTEFITGVAVLFFNRYNRA